MKRKSERAARSGQYYEKLLGKVRDKPATPPRDLFKDWERGPITIEFPGGISRTIDVHLGLAAMEAARKRS